MCFWIRLKQLLPFNRPLDIHRRNPVFLGQAMRENRYVATMEEVEQPILDVPLLRPKLVNTVPEHVSRWPAQFMSELSQQLHPLKAHRPGSQPRLRSDTG